jgi:hypothetical protein
MRTDRGWGWPFFFFSFIAFPDTHLALLLLYYSDRSWCSSSRRLLSQVVAIPAVCLFFQWWCDGDLWIKMGGMLVGKK